MKISVLLVALLCTHSICATELKPVTPEQFGEVLADSRGQIVLVSFWATWCTPCLREIPELQHVAKQFADAPFLLLPMSLDEPGDLEVLVRPFVGERFADFSSYTRVTGSMDAMVRVIDGGWNEMLPTAYLLDAKGAVLAKWQGGKTAAEFSDAIAPALAELIEN